MATSDGTDAAAAKRALRTRLRAARAGRSPAERAGAATAVSRALVAGLAEAGLAEEVTVAAFVPDAVEPGHGRLPDDLARPGTRLLLPVVPPGDGDLDWAVHTGPLAPGRFGLLEPVGPRLGVAAIGTADVVVLPAVAVARDGVRLGRGRGYYDRALRHARPGVRLVAVVFDDELVDTLPAEPHDRRVDAVVTPSGGWQDVRRAVSPR